MTNEQFRISSFCSDAHGCVEVAIGHDRVLVRDAKQKEAAVLKFDAEEWNAFIEGVKAGEFDR